MTSSCAHGHTLVDELFGRKGSNYIDRSNRHGVCFQASPQVRAKVWRLLAGCWAGCWDSVASGVGQLEDCLRPSGPQCLNWTLWGVSGNCYAPTACLASSSGAMNPSGWKPFILHGTSNCSMNLRSVINFFAGICATSSSHLYEKNVLGAGCHTD